MNESCKEAIVGCHTVVSIEATRIEKGLLVIERPRRRGTRAIDKILWSDMPTPLHGSSEKS